MPKIKMDAIEVATSIRKGDFSKLRGKSFEMCDNTNMGNKYTLNQLGLKVDRLEMTIEKLVEEMREGFKQVNNRIGNLENDVNSFKKEVNTRLDGIDTRLDYIVKANNLKDSK